MRAALGAVLVLGSVAWLSYVHRPLDDRIRSPWRQADYASIARNFYREGMNIAYPRIDWRGAGPGYVEAELPLLPWVGACLYKIFGYHEWLLRVLSAALTIGSLFLFVCLARPILPPLGTVFATAAFAANPLLFHLSTAMQPEPLMVFLSLLAVLLCWRWAERPTFPTMVAASVAVAGAILAKAPAAYLGFVLGYEILRRCGARAVVDPRVHVAALVAILPPLAWYLWARHFWTGYGNSLGLSNGDHWISLARLAPPRFLLGLLKWETLGVFTPFGWVLALAALRDDRMVRPLVWYAAVWAFYLVAENTAAGDTNYYYHIIAVAPGCLLMGGGLGAFIAGRAVPPGWGRLRDRQRRVGELLAGATLVSLVALTLAYVRLRDGRTDLLPMRVCAQGFARFVQTDQLIVVGGGEKHNGPALAGAYNVSMPFAWMDRKGFNYGGDELSTETLDRIAAQGGRFWFASKPELERDRMRQRAGERYRLLAECEGQYFLYDLRADAR